MTFPKKSFGQHFLHDTSVIDKIIAAADPTSFSLTVEVGPGTGALTLAIDSRLEAADSRPTFVLLEADRELIEPLRARFPRAEVILTDAAKFDYAQLLSRVSSLESRVMSTDWLLVGNLPYNAANAILMHALTAKNPPAQAVIMVQKEVGERLLALPGSMSVLGVAVGLYAAVERVCVVKPGAFNPPPKVDSMVVKLAVRAWQGEDTREAIIALAKAGFVNRRKLLAKNLATAGHAPLGWVGEWLTSHGYTAKARAEELTVEDWIALYRDSRVLTQNSLPSDLDARA